MRPCTRVASVQPQPLAFGGRLPGPSSTFVSLDLMVDLLQLAT